METNFTEQERYLKAKKRVKDIKGFYTHLVIYCIIIPTLIFFNLNFDPNFHWFWFSLIGWGFGLTMHWFSVFGFKYIGLGQDWEDKKVIEYMNKKNNL